MKNLVLLALVGALALPASAQDLSPMQEDLIASLEDAQQKLAGLAEAIPADKYSWQPSDGVRTVQQALVHAAAANYFFGGMLGSSAPDGVNPRELESTVTSKEAVQELIQNAFAHGVSAIENMDPNATIEWFGGQERPAHAVAMVMATHAHEHVGQLIAYARSNEIAPPWSQ